MKLYSLNFIHSSYIKSISDYDENYYAKALSHFEQSRFEESLTNLKQIANIYSENRYIELHLNTLFNLSRYNEIIEFVENLPESNIYKNYGKTVKHYILSYLAVYDENCENFCIKVNHNLNRIINNSKVRNKTKSKAAFAIFQSLFKENKLEHVVRLNKLYYDFLFSSDLYKIINGIAFYLLDDYDKAIVNLKHDYQSEEFLVYSRIFLSLIVFSKNDKSILEGVKLDDLPDLALYNVVLQKIENGYYSEATELLNYILDEEKTKLLTLFLSYELNEYQKAKQIINNIEEKLIRQSYLLTLIEAETEYNLKNYRRAETLYKKYFQFPEADKKYANHAIGYSFKGFYRYNNTAYYWLKNLTRNEKSFYDSLAVYNLARLYTFTENYHISIDYFDMFFSKYTVDDNDKYFIEDYIKTLFHRDQMVNFIRIFDLYEHLLSDSLRFLYLKKIGDFYYNAGMLERSLVYYERANEIVKTDDLSFFIERIHFSLGRYSSSADFLEGFLKKYPESGLKKQIQMDLIKYYFNQKKHQNVINLALNAIDELNNFAEQDSFYFFVGHSKRELGELDNSLDTFYNIIKHTENEYLLKESKKEFENILKSQPLSRALEIIEKKLNETERDFLEVFLLMNIAKIYEEHNFFNQANLIYYSLISTSDEEDSLDYYYYIAVNEIFQKNYHRALELLNIIAYHIDTEHYLYRDYLYLKYLVYYSLENYSLAKRNLLDFYRLYINSPEDFRNNFNIIRELVQLFENRKQYFFAYHLLHKLFESSAQTQQFIIENDYKRLKDKIESDLLYYRFLDDVDKKMFYIEKFLD